MRRIFHGWYMVAAANGLQFLQAGLMMQSFGAYVAVLSEERGWSKTALSGAAALHRWKWRCSGRRSAGCWIASGRAGFVRAGVVMFGLGLMGLSRVNTLPQFYAAFVLIALGVSCCGFFPLNVAIIHWFERWRARAISSCRSASPWAGSWCRWSALSLQT